MMREATRKNIPLIVGLALPLLMIIAVAVSIYVPRLYAEKPATDFLYVIGDTHFYGYGYSQYAVVNGRLEKQELPEELRQEAPPIPRGDVRFFVHNTEHNASREITLEEAQALTLDSLQESPDGFSLVRGGQIGGVFPFFYNGQDTQDWYLRGRGVSYSMDVRRGAGYDSLHFLGWIVE
jgi:hypothetical protein